MEKATDMHRKENRHVVPAWIITGLTFWTVLQQVPVGKYRYIHYSFNSMHPCGRVSEDLPLSVVVVNVMPTLSVSQNS